MTFTQNFTLVAGEDISIPWTIYQADGVTPQNITGWSLAFTVHDLDGTVYFVKATGGGGIALTTPLSGLATVTLNSADTLELVPRPYLFRGERTDAGADAVETRGLMIVQPR